MGKINRLLYGKMRPKYVWGGYLNSAKDPWANIFNGQDGNVAAHNTRASMSDNASGVTSQGVSGQQSGVVQPPLQGGRPTLPAASNIQANGGYYTPSGVPMMEPQGTYPTMPSVPVAPSGVTPVAPGALPTTPQGGQVAGFPVSTLVPGAPGTTQMPGAPQMPGIVGQPHTPPVLDPNLVPATAPVAPVAPISAPQVSIPQSGGGSSKNQSSADRNGASGNLDSDIGKDLVGGPEGEMPEVPEIVGAGQYKDGRNISEFDAAFTQARRDFDSGSSDGTFKYKDKKYHSNKKDELKKAKKKRKKDLTSSGIKSKGVTKVEPKENKPKINLKKPIVKKEIKRTKGKKDKGKPGTVISRWNDKRKAKRAKRKSDRAKKK